MKTVEVVAAIIIDHYTVFATQRGYGDFKDGWEFPGGKIQDKETPEEALVREIQEELDVKIKVGSLFKTIEYDYPQFHLSMQCYFASIEQGNLKLLEAEDSQWVNIEQLEDIDWLPADRTIIVDLQNELIRQTQCGIPTREQTFTICKLLTDAGYDVGPGLEEEDGDRLEFELLHIFQELPGFEGHDCSLYFSDENYNAYTDADKRRISYQTFIDDLKKALQ